MLVHDFSSRAVHGREYRRTLLRYYQLVRMARSLAVLRPRRAWVAPLNASRVDDERSTRGGAHDIIRAGREAHTRAAAGRSGERRTTGASRERGYWPLRASSAISPPPTATGSALLALLLLQPRSLRRSLCSLLLPPRPLRWPVLPFAMPLSALLADSLSILHSPSRHVFIQLRCSAPLLLFCL